MESLLPVFNHTIENTRLRALIVISCITFYSACIGQEVSIHDAFNGSSISTHLWRERVTGRDSSLELNNGAVIATAVNDPGWETGRAGLNFVNPDFQAFQADVRILAFQGVEKTRVRLEGYAYDTGMRTDESLEGEVAFYLYIRTNGKVGYTIEKCNDAGCEDRTAIASDTFANVNPGDPHTLTLGFDDTTAYFRLDNRKTITVDVAETFPVGTSGWGYAGVRARSKEASESVTAGIDNIRVGTVGELFGQ